MMMWLTCIVEGIRPREGTDLRDGTVLADHDMIGRGDIIEWVLEAGVLRAATIQGPTRLRVTRRRSERSLAAPLKVSRGCKL